MSELAVSYPADGEYFRINPTHTRYRRDSVRPMVSSSTLSYLSTHRRLEPFAPAIRKRFAAYKKQLDSIEQHEGGLAAFSEGYKSMGFQVDSKGGVRYREWAPNATAARLIGDFSEIVSSTDLF